MAPSKRAEFALLGLSHRSASVEVRERLALPDAERAAFAAELRSREGVEGALLVSTCNRVEVYVHGSPGCTDALRASFAERAGHGVLSCLYEKHGREAVGHLFRVACSLDSLVLGEPQILGQLKEAYGAARLAGLLDGDLEQAVQTALSVAKRVRTETAIGASAVSAASAAVELARKVFGALAGRSVLLLGAGAMSELAARHFTAAGARVLVANRTFAHGLELAGRVGGAAHPWESLPRLLVEADVVVSSTAAPLPVVTVPMLQDALKQRRFRSLVLVDLAVPRDVEEDAGRLENVYAYDIDDLGQVADEGRHAREAEARRAKVLVGEALDAFFRARQLRDAVPVLVELRSRAEEIARLEAARTLALFEEQALTPKQRRSIEAMSHAIVNKLLHEPTMRLREASESGPEAAAATAELVGRLFGLASTPSQPGPGGEVSEAGLPEARAGAQATGAFVANGAMVPGAVASMAGAATVNLAVGAGGEARALERPDESGRTEGWCARGGPLEQT